MNRLNIVCLGTFSYPKGMAGTKLMRAVIHGIRDREGVSVRVVILRQSSRQNPLAGTHDGVPYETVMGDIERTRAVLLAPVLLLKTMRVLERVFQPGCTNVILNYGPLDFDNALALRWSRRLGYKVVFYIVEDYDLSWGISRSLSHRFKTAGITRLQRGIKGIASGVVVITSHLREKYEKMTDGKAPIHFSPIAIDLDRFPGSPARWDEDVTLFYSGSFGSKDGLPVLLDAFDKLATKNANIRLVLTGRGTEEVMRKVLSRIDASGHKDRIDYKGYLDDDAYDAALHAATIPCMTRVNTGFANAGFPYKLGEFLATGKPVIASRVSDIGALLEDRNEIMLVRPGDSGDIVRAVESLIANPTGAMAIGTRGRAKARALFDCRPQGQALLTFLRGI